MITKINESISVKLVYNHLKKSVKPTEIYWRNRQYVVSRIGLQHTFYSGKILKHVFTVVSGETAFRLSLNTETLHWILEEVSDETV